MDDGVSNVANVKDGDPVVVKHVMNKAVAYVDSITTTPYNRSFWAIGTSRSNSSREFTKDIQLVIPYLEKFVQSGVRHLL